MNAWIECSLPVGHCPMPNSHCLLPIIARCTWTKKPLQRRITVRSVSGGPGLPNEGGENFFVFVFVIQGCEGFFVFCICYSRRLGFFVFCILYMYFLLEKGEDFLYFVFVFLFQGCKDLFVFCICISYPRIAEESFSEFWTIIKFQILYRHFQSCRNYSCVRDSECSFDSDCFGTQVGGYQLSHGRLSHGRLSHGHHMAMTWSRSVSLLKEICPPDHDYEPPDPGLCARANWVTHQLPTYTTKILKNTTRTHEPTTLTT